MKLKKYIVSIAAFLFLASTGTNACGPWWYDAKDYYLYRVYDKDDAEQRHQPDVISLNWQKLLSDRIRLEDIDEVMRSYDLERLDGEFSNKQSANTFIRWIQEHKDAEVMEYLRIAKVNEKVRALQTSKWYYPSKESGVSCTLEDVVTKCLAYRGRRLKDRYALQAVRAMYYLGNFEEMAEYWEQSGKDLPEGNIKDMCLGYVAGAWFRTGEKEKAMNAYAKLGDLASLSYCLYKLNPGRPTEQNRMLFRYIADYCPDHQHVPQLLQEWFSMDMTSHGGFIDAETCLNAARSPLCKSPAIWYYTAAYVQDREGSHYLASKTLEKAENVESSDLVGETIKVMRIYLDSKTSVYNKAYEGKLYGQLMWLYSKIEDNLTEDVREKTEDGYLLPISVDYYYWNDMLRKIIIGEVAPRMLEAGKRVLAIRLVNMADNCLLGLVNSKAIYVACEKKPENLNTVVGEYTDEDGDEVPVKIRRVISPVLRTCNDYLRDYYLRDYYLRGDCLKRKTISIDEYRNGKTGNRFDYANYLFMMLNGSTGPGYHGSTRELPVVGILDIIEYVRSLSAEDKTPFYEFIDQHSFTDLDYFNDIIGTRYLREMHYKSAVTYLSKVSSSYQKRLNSEPYMYRDPFIYIVDHDDFSESYFKSGKIISDYKLKFAKEMARLERIIDVAGNPDEKAMAMFRKGCGIRSSFSMCWALTQYSQMQYDKWQDEEYISPVIALSDKLVREAFNIVENKETEAKMYYETGLLKTLLEKCPDTKTAEFVRSNCDNAGDYNLKIIL